MHYGPFTDEQVRAVANAIEDEADAVIGEWTELGMDERVFLRELLCERVERALLATR